MLCATLKRGKEDWHPSVENADLIEMSGLALSAIHVYKLRRHSSKPIIFKLKQPDEALLSLEPDFVDLPYTLPVNIFSQIKKKFPRIKLICSYHNYSETEELESLFLKIRSYPADIYKIATFARSITDSLRMLQLVKKYKCLGICMGVYGTLTRILAPVFGAPWTYAPISENQKTASGQILLDELIEIYNYKYLTPTTALYGLIGDPIDKSISHLTHNKAFKCLGLNAVYTKMQVDPGDLSFCFKLCKDIGFKGLSITMPYKEKVLPFLDYAESRVVNTIHFRNEHLYGWNTDGVGALNAIEKKMKVQGKKIFILGAGGAACGIAEEAKKRGADLVIFNRTLSRAKKLADFIGCRGFSLIEFSKVSKEGYDILLQCTSVGMGNDPNLPIPESLLLEGRVVMDIVSQPRITPFLQAAKRKNCMTIDGMQMFLQQAAEQFRHWFNPGFSHFFEENGQNILHKSINPS